MTAFARASGRLTFLLALLRTIRLMTNHPRKIVPLDAYGIQITEQVPV